MRFPLSLNALLTWYLFKRKLAGDRFFPMVMMLEPLHACNLTCTGCGRIREYKDTINEVVSVEDCLKAVDTSGTPIVVICGGEPLIYPHIVELVNKLLERKKIVYLATNAMFLEKRLKEFKPSSRFFFAVHLDGLEETHDMLVERKGVFRMAINAIKAAKKAGFQVTVNTTIYKETDMEEIDLLLGYLDTLGVDGYMISPAGAYSSVSTQEIFMTKKDVREKFKDVDKLMKKYRLHNTPIFLEFLQGKRELSCAAWGVPTYNPKGWKGPCYLMTDGHYKTYQELVQKTDWSKYGPGNDPRCENCMVHVGYDPVAFLALKGNFLSRMIDSFKMFAWQIFAPNNKHKMRDDVPFPVPLRKPEAPKPQYPVVQIENFFATTEASRR
jgi:hopanoid biosynthesis associated radical SAM protein HpnH